MAEKGRIGVQMMMLKNDVKEKGAYEVFRQLRNMGYTSVEVSQIPMTAENVREMKRGAEDFGIDITACSAPLCPMHAQDTGENLESHYGKIVSDLHALGCRYLRIGMLPYDRMGDAGGFRAFVAEAEETADRLQKEGISLYYHNHHVDFAKIGNETMLEYFRRNTETIGFELDVFWIQRGGENPIDVIRRFDGRIELLHLKDYRIRPLTPPEGTEDGLAWQRQHFNMNVEFAEIGEGNLPMKKIIPEAVAHGTKEFFIEQDQSYGRTPMESLAISRDNLVSIGFADWFAK